MTDKEAIERAYAHMAEVEASHMRGEETVAEKAFRDAREGKGGGDATEPEAAPAPRARRPKPSEAAKAFLARQAATKRLKSVIVSTPAEAIAIWSGVQSGDSTGGSGKPALLGERAAMRGTPIPVQVWTWVRSTPGYDAWRAGRISGGAFAAEIAKWPLPRAFFDPLPPLCAAEEDVIREGRREIEEQLRRENDAGTRLRPGYSHVEEPGHEKHP